MLPAGTFVFKTYRDPFESNGKIFRLKRPHLDIRWYLRFMSGMKKFISFEDIVQGRDSTVRVTDDGLIYAVDLVMAVSGQNRDDSAKVLRRIGDDVFVASNYVERQLSSRYRH